MPQEGEKRQSSDGRTATFSGGRWQISGSSHAQPEGSALERFLKPLLPSTTGSDYLEGPKYAVQHPVDSFNLIKDAVMKDPVGAIPVVGNVKRGVQDVQAGDYAGAGGEGAAALLALLGAKKAVPGGLAEGAMDAGKSALSSLAAPLDAIGQGAEHLGTLTNKSLPAKLGMAGATAIGGHPIAALGELAIPSALEHGGRWLSSQAESLRGLSPAATESGTIDPHMPNTSGVRVSREVPGSSYPREAPASVSAINEPLPQGSFDQYMPNSSGADAPLPTASGDRLPQGSFDQYMPNSSGADASMPVASGDTLPQGSIMTGADQYQHGGDPLSVDRPSAAPVAADEGGSAPTGDVGFSEGQSLNDTLQGILESLMDKNLPDETRTVTGAPEPTMTPGGKPSVGANFYDDNVSRNAPYGEGGIMPSNNLPTELRNPALEGLSGADDTGKYDSELGMVVPHDLPAFDYEGSSTGRPGELPPPGVTIDSTAPPSLQSFEGESTGRPGEFPPSSQTVGGDLFSQATAEKPVSGFDWPEAGGRYEPDAIGSHVLQNPASLQGLKFPELPADHPMNSYTKFASMLDPIIDQAAREGYGNDHAPWRDWTTKRSHKKQ